MMEMLAVQVSKILKAENGKIGKDKESKTEKRSQRGLLLFKTGGALKRKQESKQMNQRELLWFQAGGALKREQERKQRNQRELLWFQTGGPLIS
jgi:hypothetical protein